MNSNSNHWNCFWSVRLNLEVWSRDFQRIYLILLSCFDATSPRCCKSSAALTGSAKVCNEKQASATVQTTYARASLRLMSVCCPIPVQKSVAMETVMARNVFKGLDHLVMYIWSAEYTHLINTWTKCWCWWHPKKPEFQGNVKSVSDRVLARISLSSNYNARRTAAYKAKTKAVNQYCGSSKKPSMFSHVCTAADNQNWPLLLPGRSHYQSLQ